MSIKTIYKIKSDAVKFFPSFYSDKIEEEHFWKQHHFPMEALEKVETPFITYGIEVEGTDSSARSIRYAFIRDKESRFCFTIHIPKISAKKSNEIHEKMRSIMDKFQAIINEEFYK